MTPALLGTLGIGAGLTALVAGWQQVRGFFARLAGFVVMSSEFRNIGSTAARIYCHRVLRHTPTSFRLYMGDLEFIRPLEKVGVTFRERLNGGRLMWKGWRPIWVVDKSMGNGTSPAPEGITFRYIRGTFNPDQLALDIAKTANNNVNNDSSYSKRGRFRVQRMSGRSGKRLLSSTSGPSGDQPKEPGAPASSNGLSTIGDSRLVGWAETDIGEAHPKTDPLERMALTPEAEEAIAEVRRWAASKDWYAERQIPWRRGILWHGTPGTGKSSLVKAIAQKLELPIYLLDISTMDNEEFHDAYTHALYNTPCIVLIEDVDAVFHGRENVAAEKGKGLTFDCMLNTISGVETSNGVLLMVTTNHIERVDDALGVPQSGQVSSRPGRIDRAVEMPILTQEGRVKLARRIMAGCDDSWVDHLVAQGENDTGAQFEDRCGQMALKLYWSDDPKQPSPSVDVEREVA